MVGFGGFKGFKLMDSTAMWFSKFAEIFGHPKHFLSSTRWAVLPVMSKGPITPLIVGEIFPGPVFQLVLAIYRGYIPMSLNV